MSKTSAFTTLGKILDKPAIETDWAGNIQHINPAAKHLFGLYQNDAKIEHICNCLPQADGLLNKLKNHEPSVETGLITLVDASKTPGTTFQGSSLSLEVSVIGMTNESGSSLLFVLRVLHAVSIHSKHQLIARLLNQANIPMSIIDEGGYFVEVNKSFTELLWLSG